MIKRIMVVYEEKVEDAMRRLDVLAKNARKFGGEKDKVVYLTSEKFDVPVKKVLHAYGLVINFNSTAEAAKWSDFTLDVHLDCGTLKRLYGKRAYEAVMVDNRPRKRHEFEAYVPATYLSAKEALEFSPYILKGSAGLIKIVDCGFSKAWPKSARKLFIIALKFDDEQQYLKWKEHQWAPSSLEEIGKNYGQSVVDAILR